VVPSTKLSQVTPKPQMSDVPSGQVPQSLCSRRPAFPWFRLGLLAACVAVGTLIGLVAQAMGGSSAWFLAIPALVIGAWFFVSDPTACLPSSEPRDRN